jgi:MtN3 and saliva related transmembrane protein
MAEYTQYVGIGAGICTAVSMLPQLFKILREKKAEDISYYMIAVLLIGLAGWVAYGILKKDTPIIVTNAFSFTVNMAMLLFAIKYKQRKAN